MTDKLFLIHRSMLSGGILRLGANVQGAIPGTAAFTEFEAWMWLNSEDFTSQVIPGVGDNPVSLEFAGGWVPNVGLAWNWKPRTAQKWLGDLATSGLISDDLFVALSGAIVTRKKDRVVRDAIPKKTRAAVLAKTSGLCVYCGTRLTTVSGHPNSYEPDHVLPVTLGGSDDIGNLVPSCSRCNSAKRAKTLVAFKGVSDE
jgi:hypothetical protein